MDIARSWSFKNTSTGASGSYQEFIAPFPGIYEITAAGAEGSGGNGGTKGGKGAVVSGRFYLKQNDKCIIIVGQAGTTRALSTQINDGVAGAGGGATTVSVVDTSSPYIITSSGVKVRPLLIAAGGSGGTDTRLIPARKKDGVDGVHTGDGKLDRFYQSFLSGGIGNQYSRNSQTSIGGYGGGTGTDDVGGYPGGAYLENLLQDPGSSVTTGYSYNAGTYQTGVTGGNIGQGKLEIKLIHSLKVTITPDITTTHSDHIKLKIDINDDFDLSVSYKVLINGTQKEPSSGYTDPARPPLAINHLINNADLVIGSNKITVEVINTDGMESTSEITIDKENFSPVIAEAVIEGNYIRAKINDEDGDMVKYRIVFNGLQLFPHRNFTKLINSPANIEYAIPKNLIKLNQPNAVLIEAIDSVGTLSSKEFTTTIGYTGMMFTTRDGEFYSTDLGEVLQYLDMGRVLAGSEPVIYEVFLKNTTGISMKRPKLWVVQRDLNPVSEKIELSKTKDPFEPSDEINFGKDYEIDHNQTVPFYVRVKTTDDAVGGGKFDIWVSADPM
ncbi:glycine-rich protein [Brevibacillus laterosporus]|uniref:glycine-rich protein n=1 Tax=Brevibacillus laterosporus TaxID=1465 RepID=UPI000CE352E9|nr:glycine-rich protein [Brevibacillus laterosporus]MED1666040.1 glycine-rich protein [Brevibacillus laterosporus]MED1667821.1 glycine-rich protein [Brevibacillus laterosporus]MED1719610.1 glycine-rich protein [Brevibacillus laterosporus]PPA89979.1 hypothetical protein C4A76_00430 [Brevibacillus laterosporus]